VQCGHRQYCTRGLVGCALPASDTPPALLEWCQSMDSISPQCELCEIYTGIVETAPYPHNSTNLQVTSASTYETTPTN